MICAALVSLAALLSFTQPPGGPTIANVERSYGGLSGVVWAYGALELYDPLRSWWAELLLALLGLGLLAQALARRPAPSLLPGLGLEGLGAIGPGERLRAAARGSAARPPRTVPLPSPLSPSAAEARLAARGYRVELLPPDEDGAVRLLAEKGRAARAGAWVVHLALLLGVALLLSDALLGFDGRAILPQRGEADSMEAHSPDGALLKRRLTDDRGRIFLVRTEALRLGGGAPEADLSFLERKPDASPGDRLAQGTVSARKAFEFSGLRFRLADVRELEGDRAKLVLIDKAQAGRSQELSVGGDPIEPVPGLRYQLADYSKDFAGQGPAVQIRRVEQGPPVRETAFWVFSKAPRFDADNREDRFAFSFLGIEPAYAPTVAISRAPPTWLAALTGMLLAGGGLAVLLAGHSRVWVRLASGELSLGGTAAFAGRKLEAELETLAADLLAAAAAPAPADAVAAAPAPAAADPAADPAADAAAAADAVAVAPAPAPAPPDERIP